MPEIPVVAKITCFLAVAAIDQYTFRIQYLARSVAKRDRSQGITQTDLLPVWYSPLVALNLIVKCALIFELVKSSGWAWAGFAASYLFLMSWLTDIVSPLPSSKHCFNIYEAQAKRLPAMQQLHARLAIRDTINSMSEFSDLIEESHDEGASEDSFL